jgi:hypothetical protein
MEEIVSRFWDDLWARGGGPLHFRFVLQPLVATLFAIRSGRRDAREHRPLFFWTALQGSAARREFVKQLCKGVGKLFLVACILDLIYQLIAFRWVYPAETLAVAILLAILPYLVVRGLTNRVLSALPAASSVATEKTSENGSSTDQSVIHSE